MWKLFYFADIVDSLETALGWFLALSVVLFIATFIGRLIYRFDSYYDIDSEKTESGNLNPDRQKYLHILKLNRIGLVTLLLLSILIVVTPSKNTIYLMAGGKLVDMTIENNPQIKEVPGKTIDLLNAWLEKEINSVENKKENTPDK